MPRLPGRRGAPLGDQHDPADSLLAELDTDAVVVTAAIMLVDGLEGAEWTAGRPSSGVGGNPAVASRATATRAPGLPNDCAASR
jgi:hypothetical protein